MSNSTRYSPRPSYTLMVGLGLVVSLLFAWEVGQHFAWPTLFFFVCALGFVVVNLRWATTSIELTPTGMTVYRRLAAPQPINFRQMATVEVAGRTLKGITLIYYPLNERKLIDLDNPRSLFLPGLNDQAQLLEILQTQIAT